MPAAPDPFIARRMRAQRLTAPMAADPAAVVAWFGAVQAQDYQGAKWALTLRAPALTDARIDRALADGTIIRTHGPRPTWHFIAQADARWVLTAVAPRVQLRSRTMYRTYEIDAALMTHARRIVEKALGGGQFLTRAAIGKALAAKGIEAAGIRLGLMVFVLELDQVVCSGPRQGKQFTYALFDERVRGALVLPPDEARTALAARYVASHGPVTVNDFVWWSGLTVGEAKRAFEAVSPALRTEQIGEDTYWSSPTEPKATRRDVPPVHLMPNYDEYFIAYRDRRPDRGAAAAERAGRSDGQLCAPAVRRRPLRRVLAAHGRLACGRGATPALPHVEPRARGRGQGGGWTLRRVPRPAAGVQRAAGAAGDAVKPQRAISA